MGVLGAGLMGAGIATAFARSGFPTAMMDVDQERLNDGLKRASEVVLSRIKIGRATPRDLAHMLGLLSTGTTPGIFADSDIVIEAITEDEALKTESYRKLGWHLRGDAILASNTSTISIDRMAASVPHPERFLGMHFFHPVDRMELVEVIRGEKTSEEALATVVALAKRIRKTPIVVRDGPGFLVNRVLFPYLNEAMLLLQEGADAKVIDRVATQFGMPMGPLALLDMVGLDTALYAARVLAQAFPERTTPAPILKALVARAAWARSPAGGSGNTPAVMVSPRPIPNSSRSWRTIGPATAPRRTRRSRTACSCPCFWKQPACWRKGSSASLATWTSA